MRREPAVESDKNDRRHTLSSGLRISSLNLGELLPVQGQRLLHVYMPPAAQRLCREPRMAVVPRGNDQGIDSLLRKQSLRTGGSFGETELLSIMNGIQAICRDNGV